MQWIKKLYFIIFFVYTLAMTLHIVLVEPEIPQNTGNIARTCAALGATLHLVEPLGFSIDEKSVRRAGLDYWDKLSLHTYPSLVDFLATHEDKELLFVTTKGKQVYSDYPYSNYLHSNCPAPDTSGNPDTEIPKDSALHSNCPGSQNPRQKELFLLFGKESAGLPEELLVNKKEKTLRVPMAKGNRSLNLSNTVAILAYEVYRQWGFPELENTGELHHLTYTS